MISKLLRNCVYLNMIDWLCLHLEIYIHFAGDKGLGAHCADNEIIRTV